MANKDVQKIKDFQTNKLLLVFTGAFFLILGIMFVGRMMSSTATYVGTWNAMKITAVVSGILTILSVIWAVVRRPGEYELFTGVTFAAFFAVICASTTLLAFMFNKEAIGFLYVFIGILTLLYIIYTVYPFKFFVISVINLASAILLWAAYRALGAENAFSTEVALFLISAVILAAIGLVVPIFFKKKYAKEPNLTANYVNSLVVFLAAGLMFLNLPFNKSYIVFGLIGVFACMAIYYTFKLDKIK